MPSPALIHLKVAAAVKYASALVLEQQMMLQVGFQEKLIGAAACQAALSSLKGWRELVTASVTAIWVLFCNRYLRMMLPI